MNGMKLKSDLMICYKNKCYRIIKNMLRIPIYDSYYFPKLFKCYQSIFTYEFIQLIHITIENVRFNA